MDILAKLRQKAKANPQRIVLPESLEERTLSAADIILAEGLAKIILIGNPKEITAKAEELGLKNISKATILDTTKPENVKPYCDLLYNLRKNKGMTEEQAAETVKNPLYIASLMLKNGDADGEVAGAMNSTGNVLRPALQIVKTRKGISTVSGAFLMLTNNEQYGEQGVFLFADCAVTPVPTAQQLAEIACSTADSARALAGYEPKIAMLSFSTKGSASHEVVDKVVEATRIAKEMNPALQIDGELQADAAIVPSVAKSKAKGSDIAGQANVLVFPNLEAGNIAYKLVQRISNSQAIGPILHGMAAPINDLSRGCNIDDVIQVIIITANQAIAAKENK